MNNTPEEIEAAQATHDKIKALIAVGDIDGALRALEQSLTDAINKAINEE